MPGLDYLNGTREASPKIALIIRAHLQGMSKPQICREFHVSLTSLKRIMASPLYQERIAHLQHIIDQKTVEAIAEDPVRKELCDAAIKAAQRNVALMDSTDERISQASAWDVLDRAGYVKKQRSEVEHTTKAFLSDDQVKAIGEALAECRK